MSKQYKPLTLSRPRFRPSTRSDTTTGDKAIDRTFVVVVVDDDERRAKKRRKVTYDFHPASRAPRAPFDYRRPRRKPPPVADSAPRLADAPTRTRRRHPPRFSTSTTPIRPRQRGVRARNRFGSFVCISSRGTASFATSRTPRGDRASSSSPAPFGPSGKDADSANAFPSRLFGSFTSTRTAIGSRAVR